MSMWRKGRRPRLPRGDESVPCVRGRPAAHPAASSRRKRARQAPPIRTRARRRSLLENRPLFVGEGVEPGGQERLNRRRHAVGVTPFRKHREQLLDEQRVPSATSECGSGCPRRAPSRREAPRSAPLTRPAKAARASGSRRWPGHPRGALVEQLRPREAQQEHRASRVQLTRCSTRSSSVGSAQCTSSMTSASAAAANAARTPSATPRRSRPSFLRGRPRAPPRHQPRGRSRPAASR